MIKVFISSTYVDLKQHRADVIDALLRMRLEPVAMEFFGAQPAEPTRVCQQEIQGSDLLVGIYAHRYGHVPAGGDPRSITEREYDLAQKKPRFCYLVNPDWSWPLKFIEKGPGASKLVTFKQRVGREVMYGEFTTPDNLALHVITDLARWLCTNVPDEWHRLVSMTLASLAEINKRLRPLKDLHHRLQEIALDLDMFQDDVQSVQQASLPIRIENLRYRWQRQVSPKLGNLGESLEKEVEDDIHKRIDEIIQWKLILEDALKDKHSTIDDIHDLVSEFWSICTRHLLWADSELHEAASRSCELSDRLIILTEVTHDNQK